MDQIKSKGLSQKQRDTWIEENIGKAVESGAPLDAIEKQLDKGLRRHVEVTHKQEQSLDDFFQEMLDEFDKNPERPIEGSVARVTYNLTYRKPTLEHMRGSAANHNNTPWFSPEENARIVAATQKAIAEGRYEELIAMQVNFV